MFKNLRRKPRAVRERYAFWYAAGATGVIALIWTLSLQYRLDDTFTEGEFAADEQVGAFANFFSDAKQNFANVISSADDAEPLPEDPPAIVEEPAPAEETDISEMNDDSRASFLFASSTSGRSETAGPEKPVRIATTTATGNEQEQ